MSEEDYKSEWLIVREQAEGWGKGDRGQGTGDTEQGAGKGTIRETDKGTQEAGGQKVEGGDSHRWTRSPSGRCSPKFRAVFFKNEPSNPLKMRGPNPKTTRQQIRRVWGAGVSPALRRSRVSASGCWISKQGISLQLSAISRRSRATPVEFADGGRLMAEGFFTSRQPVFEERARRPRSQEDNELDLSLRREYKKNSYQRA